MCSVWNWFSSCIVLKQQRSPGCAASIMCSCCPSEKGRCRLQFIPMDVKLVGREKEGREEEKSFTNPTLVLLMHRTMKTILILNSTG